MIASFNFVVQSDNASTFGVSSSFFLKSRLPSLPPSSYQKGLFLAAVDLFKV